MVFMLVGTRIHKMYRRVLSSRISSERSGNRQPWCQCYSSVYSSSRKWREPEPFFVHPAANFKTYVLYNTAHLLKNTHNNLHNRKKFVFPVFNFDLNGVSIGSEAGYISWDDLHKIFDTDMAMDGNLLKTRKYNICRSCSDHLYQWTLWVQKGSLPLGSLTCCLYLLAINIFSGAEKRQSSLELMHFTRISRKF